MVTLYSSSSPQSISFSNPALRSSWNSPVEQLLLVALESSCSGWEYHSSTVKQSVCTLQTQIACQASCDNYKALGAVSGQCPSPDLGQALRSHWAAQLTVSHTTQPWAPAVPPGSQPPVQESSCENSILLTVGTHSLNSQEENKTRTSPLIASVSNARGKGESEAALWSAYLQIGIHSAYYLNWSLLSKISPY